MARSEQEVQRLMAELERNEREKRELVKKLSRVQSQTSPTPVFEPRSNNYPSLSSSRPSVCEDGLSRSGTMPRSATASLGPQIRHAHQDQSRPMKRSKTTHAAGSSSMLSMMRSSSSIPSAGSHLNQFVANGPSPFTPPTMPNTVPVTSYGSLGSYLGQTQFAQPFLDNDQILPSQPQHDDVGREMNIDEFLSMRDDEFMTTSPITIPPPTMPAAQGSEQYISSSIPSACGSMTSGPTTGTAPMSRCQSTLNDDASISGRFSMVRIQSQQSTQGHLRQDSFAQSQTFQLPSSLGKRPSVPSDLLPMPTDSFQYPTYPSSAPADSILSQRQHAMESSQSQSSFRSTSSAGLSPVYDLNSPFLAQHLSMERSISKDSVKSNASLQHRAKEALARQNGNAAKARHLQPKPAASAFKQENSDVASSGIAKTGKTAIAKSKYERPKHPKIPCNQCNEQPEGFRGEHELRRHTEAKHKSMVKKWICRDPDLYGIPHSETAVKALKDCKQCSQEKQYGAYYNAAAHLRRTHFKVKPRKGAAGAKNGSGLGKADEEREKRGGKGGGDWPSMSELKLWMVEVIVPMDKAGPLVPDGNESVGFVEAEDIESELADTQYNSQPGLGMGVGTDGFDMAAFAGVGGGFGPTIDAAGASFQSAEGDLGSQLSEMYRLFPPPSLPGAPISSAAFDYSRSPDVNVAPHVASALMGIDNHGYTSPVSSAATVTNAHPVVFPDQMHLPTAMQALNDDLPDFPFDLTFTTAGQ